MILEFFSLTLRKITEGGYVNQLIKKFCPESMIGLLFQLVEQFLTDNVKISGSGPEVLQSQLYIGKYTFNSFLPSRDFCHLLISFANSLDPDQDQQNVSSVDVL